MLTQSPPALPHKFHFVRKRQQEIVDEERITSEANILPFCVVSRLKCKEGKGDERFG